MSAEIPYHDRRGTQQDTETITVFVDDVTTCFPPSERIEVEFSRATAQKVVDQLVAAEIVPEELTFLRQVEGVRQAAKAGKVRVGVCHICTYFEGNATTGFCQRYPESVHHNSGHWCGEFKYCGKEKD